MAVETSWARRGNRRAQYFARSRRPDFLPKAVVFGHKMFRYFLKLHGGELRKLDVPASPAHFDRKVPCDVCRPDHVANQRLNFQIRSRDPLVKICRKVA